MTTAETAKGNAELPAKQEREDRELQEKRDIEQANNRKAWQAHFEKLRKKSEPKTLRDEFAMTALAVLGSGKAFRDVIEDGDVSFQCAKFAYRVADWMLHVRTINDLNEE